MYTLCYSVQRTLCHCERSVAISRKGNLVKKWLKFVAEKFGFIGFCDENYRFLQLSKIILVSFAVFNARKTQHIVVGKILEDFRYFS